MPKCLIYTIPNIPTPYKAHLLSDIKIHKWSIFFLVMAFHLYIDLRMELNIKDECYKSSLMFG